MPLSEREQQILQEIEQSLYEEDPQFARHASRFRPFDTARLTRLGALSLLGGIASLVAFFVTSLVALGVIAFVAMVAGIVALATATHALLAGAKPASERARRRLEAIFKSFDTRLRDHRRRG